MDQTNEEALRQELSYLRSKLQDQSPPTQDYTQEMAALTEHCARVEHMLSGKLLHVKAGDILFIERNELFTHMNKWHELSQKFQITLVPSSSIENISFLDEDTLKKAGLKKIKSLDPYLHLDELMHHLNKDLIVTKDTDAEYSSLLKGCMDKVFEAMEAVQLLKDPEGEKDGVHT